MVRSSGRNRGAPLNLNLFALENPTEIERRGRAARRQLQAQNQAQNQAPPASPAPAQQTSGSAQTAVSPAASAQLAAAVEDAPQEPDAGAAESPAPLQSGAHGSPEPAEETVPTPGVTTPSPEGEPTESAAPAENAVNASPAPPANQPALPGLPGLPTATPQDIFAQPQRPNTSAQVPRPTPQDTPIQGRPAYGRDIPHCERSDEKFKKAGGKRRAPPAAGDGDASKRQKSSTNPSNLENLKVKATQQAGLGGAQTSPPPINPDYDPCGYFHHELNRYLAEVTRIVRQDIKQGQQFEDWQVANALASVTDAINNTRASQQRDRLFSLITPQSWQWAESYPPTEDYRVLDPRLQALIPIQRTRNIGGRPLQHLSLLHLARPRGGNGPFNLLHYDSSPNWRLLTPNEQKSIHTQLLDTNWTGDAAGTQGYTNPATLNRPQQTHARSNNDRDWICGLHVILNGWALALDLTIGSFGLEDGGNFARDAVTMVNLATMGRMDSKTILAFFKCHKFVDEEDQVPLDRQFAASTAFDGANGVGDHVRDMIAVYPARQLPPSAQAQAAPAPPPLQPSMIPSASNSQQMQPSMAPSIHSNSPSYGSAAHPLQDDPLYGPNAYGRDSLNNALHPQSSSRQNIPASSGTSIFSGMSASDQALLGRINQGQRRAEDRTDEQAEADEYNDFGAADPYVHRNQGSGITRDLSKDNLDLERALQADFDSRREYDLDANRDPGEFLEPLQVAPRAAAAAAAQEEVGDEEDEQGDDDLNEELFGPGGARDDDDDKDDNDSNDDADLPGAGAVSGMQSSLPAAAAAHSSSSYPTIPSGSDPDLRLTPSAGPSSSPVPTIPSSSDADLRISSSPAQPARPDDVTDEEWQQYLRDMHVPVPSDRTDPDLQSTPLPGAGED